jgi:hypothetical protein
MQSKTPYKDELAREAANWKAREAEREAWWEARRSFLSRDDALRRELGLSREPRKIKRRDDEE